jgi:hypothetical protein
VVGGRRHCEALATKHPSLAGEEPDCFAEAKSAMLILQRLQ